MAKPDDWNRPDEILAIVDNHDREIGGERRDVIHQRELLHRAVHVFVFGRDGRLLIQQRSTQKDTYPLHWECVGGHLSPGEEYPVAAAREVHEELGVTARHLKLLTKLSACRETGWEFIEVYRATIHDQPVPHPAEVITVEWIRPEAVLAEIATENRLFSPSFLHSIIWTDVLSGRGA